MTSRRMAKDLTQLRTPSIVVVGLFTAFLWCDEMQSVGATVMAKQATRAQRVVELPEPGLRRLALSTKLPSYPAESIKKGVTGVVVVMVVVEHNGQVRTVTVIESPDAAIADSVRAAVLTWKFKTPSVGAVSGKLTFYYRLENGKGFVTGPALRSAPTSSPGASTSPHAPVVVLPGHSETIGEAEMTRLMRSPGAVLLDSRIRHAYRRQHRPGALNIPLDELPVRAYTELRNASLVVIDCTNAELRECGVAAQILREEGIRRVFVFRP